MGASKCACRGLVVRGDTLTRTWRARFVFNLSHRMFYRVFFFLIASVSASRAGNAVSPPHLSSNEASRKTSPLVLDASKAIPP